MISGFSEMDILSHLFEVSGWLNFADGLHESVPDNDADVGTWIVLGLLSQRNEVFFSEAVWGCTEVELEHDWSCVFLRKWDVNTFLKPEPYKHSRDVQSLESV